MNFKSNQQRFKHSESVFEALLHLGGKATHAELVKRIAESVGKPEDAIESEVKHVLRAAVLNGYLVRHGKNYLISRSCRTMCTDSRNSTTDGTRNEDEKESSFTVFGFPLWWNRFWNRFVVSKERSQLRCAQNRKEGLITEPVQETDTHENTILNKDSSDSNESKEIVSDNCAASSLIVHETVENQSTEELKEEIVFETVSTDSKPTHARCDKDLKAASDLNNSNEAVNGSDFFWLNDESKNDSWMD